MRPKVRVRELAHNVELFPAQTPTLPPATHTNSYALGGREVLLVEPSPGDEGEQRAWLAWARSLPSRGRRAVAVLVTHHHRDHVGGAALLSRELGLPLWAHGDTAARLPGVVVERCLDDGDTIDLAGVVPERWHVLHTPGHAPGHLCLHDPVDGTVVVGDMVASVGTILVAPEDGDMAVYIQQLERLEALGARVALPAHGDPIDEPAALFRRYVVHRRMREGKVLRALAARGARGATPRELLPDAYADAARTQWPLALLSLVSHLRKLVDDGQVAFAGERYVCARAVTAPT